MKFLADMGISQSSVNWLRQNGYDVIHLLERGELPGFKVGANWRFRKEDIDKWIEDNKKMNVPAKKQQNKRNRR